jgi:hypothetical protein
MIATMSIKQKGKPEDVYFAHAPGYLDIYTLSYRWFGAVWTLNNELQQLVRGYWFGNEQEEVIRQAKHAGWHFLNEVKNEGIIRPIYEAFRRMQRELDWNKRSRLSIRSSVSRPWRTVKPGWYIIRSRDQFPLYISSVQKRGWIVYLEHADVCENETDIRNFIDKVNCEHNIKFQECNWNGGL